MEAPAEVEWSTAGKWRRRPAQPAAVLTGSASPTPFPAKLYPLKTAQMPLYAVGVVPARRQPQSGRISALAGREGRLRACTPELKATSPTATTKHSYNIHHFKAMHYPGRWPGLGGAFQWWAGGHVCD